jgi:ketosteroid isomerase-like protein
MFFIVREMILTYLNSEMNPKLEHLFKQYEEAFSRLDFNKIAEFYADSFTSAGPKGTIAQSKEEFLKMAEKTTAFYKSVGQTSAKLLSTKETPISEQYAMVTTHWGVTFRKTGDKPVEFDISYIVQMTGSEPKIIMFITHQDEDEAMKKLQLV